MNLPRCRPSWTTSSAWEHSISSDASWDLWPKQNKRSNWLQIFLLFLNAWSKLIRKFYRTHHFVFILFTVKEWRMKGKAGSLLSIEIRCTYSPCWREGSDWWACKPQFQEYVLYESLCECATKWTKRAEPGKIRSFRDTLCIVRTQWKCIIYEYS